MMKNATILLAMLFCAAAGEMLQSAVGEPTGIGGNIAGSIITIPTASPVPYNESCAVGTYVLNGSSIGIYCNTNDYFNWYYDWTSYATPINTSSDGSAKADWLTRLLGSIWTSASATMLDLWFLTLCVSTAPLS